MTIARPWRRAVSTLSIASALLSCGKPETPPARPTLELARRKGAHSRDGEVLGRWLLDELVSPSGDPAKAKEARAALEQVPHEGMYGSLARAVDDGEHGQLPRAADAYLAALRAARASTDPLAPLVAWFATNHLLSLAPNVSGLWESGQAMLEETIDHPGAIGWRARGELVSWWSQQAQQAAKAGALDGVADRHGCLRKVRLAGPFGHGAPGDRRRVFGAEQPGPWPYSWTADEGIHAPPHLLKVERHGCQIKTADAVPGGIFYAETFVDLPAERDVLLAVQGAFRVSVDDAVVLDRDTRVWGVWSKFTVRLRLAAGRHRILARLGAPDTSLRLMRPDGTPLGSPSSDDPLPAYAMTPPLLLGDPNVLSRFVSDGREVPSDDMAARYLASYLAHSEEQDDVAAVIAEPLVSEPSLATPFALAMAATFAEKDPIFPEAERHDLARDMRQRAVIRDAELWWPRFWLLLDEAEKKGLPDAVDGIRKLAEHFPSVPEIPEGLAQLYGRLSWTAERSVVLKELATRFPKNARVLSEVLEVLEEEGQHPEADRIAAKLREVDPDSEVQVDRALARHDFPAAIAELTRLGQRRPDRKDIQERIADVRLRAGDPVDTRATLQGMLARKPRDAGLRLALADARLASGDKHALRHAVADAILVGGSKSELSDALELIEGVTELEPYRIDGPDIVRAFERSGVEMEGNAARVLDYAAVWIHPDGSSRMLEHELVRIQSQEAIGKLAEQKVPAGLLLHLRVLKKDGTILEPELVAGKNTATMPHLELGDYIETESISSEPGDGQLGRRYLGPHWFFREADIAYWRSEFVAIAPKDKPLAVETRGDVPAPVVHEQGPVVIRRWRVDMSPPAPEEPGSAPVQEFLPSIRLGWGITLSDHLRRLTDAASDELPRDPRIVRIAGRISEGSRSDLDRARAIYHWLLSNVEDGRETDARRVVIGKSGNRAVAFAYLCRTLGVPVEMGVSKDKLSAPPLGPISEAEQYDDFLLRVPTASASTWLTVRDKFAPYGYVPSALRGQPVYRLVPGNPREVIASSAFDDGIVYEGRGELRSDGSAVLALVQKFVGQPAIGLRAGLEQLPPAQLHGAVEGKLLAQALPGARLLKLNIEHQADLDQPLLLRMDVEVSDFARRRGEEWVLTPPFAIRITQVTALPTRQTPLVLGAATSASVHLTLKLPAGARVLSSTRPVEIRDHDRLVVVRDRQDGPSLIVDREVRVPAGRVEPQAYRALQDFARRADEATLRDIVVGAGG